MPLLDIEEKSIIPIEGQIYYAKLGLVEQDQEEWIKNIREINHTISEKFT